MQRYDALFERNAKSGSFYLQSKVHRAKEALEAVYRGDSPGTSWNISTTHLVQGAAWCVALVFFEEVEKDLSKSKCVYKY